jgi:hypothetical protein
MRIRLLPWCLELHPKEFPVREHHESIRGSTPADELDLEHLAVRLSYASNEVLLNDGLSHNTSRVV